MSGRFSDADIAERSDRCGEADRNWGTASRSFHGGDHRVHPELEAEQEKAEQEEAVQPRAVTAAADDPPPLAAPGETPPPSPPEEAPPSCVGGNSTGEPKSVGQKGSRWASMGASNDAGSRWATMGSGGGAAHRPVGKGTCTHRPGIAM